MMVSFSLVKHGLSACLHTILLFFLLISSWLRKKNITNRPNWSLFTGAWCFALFNLWLCTSNYYGHYHEDILTQFDFVVRVIAWFAILPNFYFQQQQQQLPIFLTLWLCFFFIISSSFVVIDIVVLKQSWIMDIVSVGFGFYLFITGLWSRKKKKEQDTAEPLLCNREESLNVDVSPLSTASFFSFLSFSWLNPLLALGNQRAINLEDVPQFSVDDSVNRVFPIFRDKLTSTTASEITSFSLAKAFLLSTWKEILCTALLSILYSSAAFVGPYLIDSFVKYLDNPPELQSKRYMLVFAFILSKFVQSLSQRHNTFKLAQVGVRVKQALTATVYNKLMTLSYQSRQVHSSGEIVNLMAVDVRKVSGFSSCLHDWWKVPIEITLALVILYKNLGVASFAALVVTVLVILANIPLGKLQKKLQGQMMECKDKRMKATSEILRNMKILKIQAWEMNFLSKIVALRETEEGWLRNYMYVRTVSTFIFFVGPTIVAVVTFGVCVLIGIPLEPGKILSAIATFDLLKEAIFYLPLFISMLTQARVSLDRISSFLSLEDVQHDITVQLPRTSKVAIEICNGCFSWDVSSPNAPKLKDVNLQVFHGMRVGICGTVGSGKSSLLSCILGEMMKLSGNVSLCGTKAYVSQSPWIQSGNIEENILFGKEMDRERYRRVIEACSLGQDIESLPFGDNTVIGERGINLSGGQKQRVQIARALYQDADIYLFDDPFSALDAHTGMHLYKECLLKFLDSKTVIYTTNQVEFLPSADLILVMKDGKIVESGKYNEIHTSGSNFIELTSAHRKALLGDRNLEADSTTLTYEAARISDDEKSTVEESSKLLCQSSSSINEEVLDENQTQIVQEEEREKGRVGIDVYWKYITSYSGTLVLFILLVQIMSQVLQVGSNYWMTRNTSLSKDVRSHVEASTLIYVYAGLAFGSCILVFVRAIGIGTAGYKVATILFKRMHLCIFRAPMSFFDATPSGRILNRVSNDQNEVDYSIPAVMGGVAMNTIRLIAVVAVMAMGAWQVCIIYVPVVVACIWYQQYYIATARELVRLSGVCNAPLKQHFVESISGLTTIKSFQQESRFMETNMQLIDNCSRPGFYSVGANEWLGFRLDVLASVTFSLTLVVLVFMPKGVINPAIEGLAVTYGLNLTTLQAFVIGLLGMLESDIISVERILQYSCIPSEAPLVINSHRPASNWPSHGEVTIRHLQVRYAPHLPVILRNITCTFPGGKKTGIVGRTGCGKSTLSQALFRMVEAASGEILIDGINISTLGLHDLRSRLSIIPQDPIMFDGTVRTNLDPLEEYTDEQIWEALDKCELGVEVRKKEEKLDSTVTENGENWSMGQRQLVCLGRVLLKRSKILVLDEATSSVDTATDNLIQKTLRQHVPAATVVSIAHRVTSVLDSDVILVLDNGQVVEYHSPNRLLENKNSSFAKLVNEQVQASYT